MLNKSCLYYQGIKDNTMCKPLLCRIGGVNGFQQGVVDAENTHVGGDLSLKISKLYVKCSHNLQSGQDHNIATTLRHAK